MKLTRIKSYLLCLTLAWTAGTSGVLEAVGEGRDLYRFKSVAVNENNTSLEISLENSENQRNFKIRIAYKLSKGETIVDGVCRTDQCFFAVLDEGNSLTTLIVQLDSAHKPINSVRMRGSTRPEVDLFAALQEQDASSNAPSEDERRKPMLHWAAEQLEREVECTSMGRPKLCSPSTYGDFWCCNAGEPCGTFESQCKESPPTPTPTPTPSATPQTPCSGIVDKTVLPEVVNTTLWWGNKNAIICDDGSRRWVCPKLDDKFCYECGQLSPKCKRWPLPPAPNSPSSPPGNNQPPSPPPASPKGPCTLNYTCQQSDGSTAKGTVTCRPGDLSYNGPWGSLNCKSCQKTFKRGCSESTMPPATRSFAPAPARSQSYTPR
jgi:hypothetical protein